MLLLLLIVACNNRPAEPLPAPRGAFPVWTGEAPRDLIVLSIDTLRRDRLGSYGGPPQPFLDDLAARSARLDAHRSCSNWTWASVLCAQTGRDNISSGSIPSMGGEAIGPEVPTLATALAAAGYSTHLASANPLFSTDNQTAAGFGEVHDLEGAPLLDLYDALDLPETGPLYLHLHAFEPHAPYDPPERYLEGLEDLPPIRWDLSTKADHYDMTRSWLGMVEEEREAVRQHLDLRYAGELRWLDDQLAELWSTLGDEGWLEDALVLLWSDHGEQFWEHGQQSHGYALHPEETDAIAWFWTPSVLPVAWTEPTTHADLAPTVLGALGLPALPGQTGQVVGEASPDRALFGLSDARVGVVQSVRQGDLQLHYWWSGSKQLYDLASDPGEQVDLYDPEDPRVAELWELLRAELERARPLVDARPVDPGP